MQLAKFDAETATLEDILPALDGQGYAVIENALDEISLTRLQRELEPYFQQRPKSKAHFFGFNTTRIEALFLKSTVAQAMAVHPLVLAASEHILGPNCDHFQINLTQGIRILPGEKAQIIHPDSAMFPIANKPFEFQVNALWAYTPFLKENGATQIVPGSHRWEEGRQPQPHEITHAEMEAGSVLIYAASLLHGGGANITSKHRTGIAISYCLGWLRQSENQYLSYPPQVAKTFSEKLQRLIGYEVHRPNLGWVFGHSPMDLLRETNNPDTGAEDFLTPEQESLLRAYHEGMELAVTTHRR